MVTEPNYVEQVCEYSLHEETAKAWLADWGSYWYKWRDRDELGFPRVNVLHESHGVSGGDGSIPEMPERVLFVDQLFRRWTKHRRSVAWVVWVDEAGEMQGWQRECMAHRYGIKMGRQRFGLEIVLIVNSVTSAVIIAEG